jgi:hypothetical protein
MYQCHCGYGWNFTGKSQPRCPKCKSRKVSDKDNQKYEIPMSSGPSGSVRASLCGFHAWTKEQHKLKDLVTISPTTRVNWYKEYVKSLGINPSF